LDRFIRYRKEDERDERNARHAVSLETVCAGADGVARVIPCTVGDDARVSSVVLLDLENDLHQVGANVRDLCENPAGDSKRRSAERLADCKSNETGSGIFSRNEEQDTQHDDQLDGNQQHADAHAGLERDRIAGKRFAPQSGEGGARVGKCIDTYAERRDGSASQHANHGKQENYCNSSDAEVLETVKIDGNDDRDKSPELHDELHLREEISLAGF